MKVTNLLLFPVLLSLTSCSVNEGNTVAMDNVRYINDFPNSGDLVELDADYDEIGLKSLKVVDSLLIISHRDHWNITDSSLISRIHCFNIGAGPGEFLSIPYAHSSAFRCEQDSLTAYVFDSRVENIKAINLTGLLSKKEQEIPECVSRDQMPPLLWDVVPCGGTTFLMHVPNETRTGFKRILFSDGQENEIEITRPLSDNYVDNCDNINLLAKVTIYDNETGRFVEAMTSLDQINIYSKDGLWGQTICVGDKLDDISSIQRTPKAVRKYTYLVLSPLEKGFAASYSGMSAMNFEVLGQNSTDIQIFNWDGEPVYRFNFPFYATHLDIDFKNGILYVIDASEDRLRKFDATPIVNAFEATY